VKAGTSGWLRIVTRSVTATAPPQAEAKKSILHIIVFDLGGQDAAVVSGIPGRQSRQWADAAASEAQNID
jgi:hypothetical protein